MDDRTKTFFSFLLVAGSRYVGPAAATLSSPDSKCPSSRRLPKARRRRSTFPNLPPFSPMSSSSADIPAVILTNPQIPQRRTAGRRHRAARRAAFPAREALYQANDLANARREFDRAIDLMLEASEQDPVDRQDFERKLDEMVDSIHRYDLGGPGRGRQRGPEPSSKRRPSKTSCR